MPALLVCWLVFPVVLGTLALGAGLLVEAIAGAPLAGALLVPAGLGVLIVAAGLTTLTSATAPLTTPVAVAIAAAGLVTGLPRRRPHPYAPAAAVVAFLAVAAPVLLSGAATVVGYIELDDTATFLAIGDRVLDHGRSLAGLAPSSYEATLDSYLAHGYPVGSILPLAIGHELTGQDVAWLYQPYLALLAAVLALVLFALLEPVVRSRAARAGAAALAAQPALLYGYAQWGGVKELAGAALIPLIAALAARVRSARQTIPVAVAVAALLGVLSVGALVWVPVAVVPALWPWRGWRLVVVLGAATVALAMPAILAIRGLVDVSAPRVLQSASELGNLLRPLRFAQILGIWPTGDFRTEASPLWAAALLLLLAGVASLGGLGWAWRCRAWGALAYVVSALLGACLLAAFASPWAAGKGLAMASPALVCAALVGCAGLGAVGRQWMGVALAATLAAGVLWSNVLAYRAVSLAPRDRLAELQRIGERFAGQGPALMTEYEPYGVRHFLRRLDAEGASELRRRPIPLRDGRVLEKGEYADLDAFQPAAVLGYRTLVLRRSPAESRPPPQYSLMWLGRWYEVWQRPAAVAGGSVTLPLGDAVQPGGIPVCREVRSLAGQGALLAAPREPNVVAALGGGSKPSTWRTDSLGYVYPAGAGRLQLSVSLPRPGVYRAWLGGSVRGRLELRVDGRRAGATERELNRGAQYLYLGELELAAGVHVAELHLSVPPLAPGVAGPAVGLGPLVFEPVQPETVVSAAGDGVRALCGRQLDWIAAAAG
jgi:hypothetical protein